MTDTADHLLRAEHLTKQFKRRTVVRDVSLEIGEGHIVGLLGPNGAGKTTTFRMIVGMLGPTQGRIWFRGHEITQMPMYLRAPRHRVSSLGAVRVPPVHGTPKPPGRP